MKKQIMIFEYNENKQIIESFYNKLGLTNEFDKDNIYLERAFNEINEIFNKLLTIMPKSNLEGPKTTLADDPQSEVFVEATV